MKKLEFQAIVKSFKNGDILIIKIRPHQFMPSRDQSFSPFVHCVFVNALAEAIEVHFEGTINEGGAIGGGYQLPNRINYARIESIEKISIEANGNRIKNL